MQELMDDTSFVLAMLQCVHTCSWAHLFAFLHILCRYGKGQTPMLMSSDAH